MAWTTDTLPDDAPSLKAIVNDQAKTIDKLESALDRLEGQLRLFQKQQYKTRSEKYPDQSDLFAELFNEIEVVDDHAPEKQTSVEAHTRQARAPRTLCADLPRVEVVHDVPEDEKRCACGQPLQPIADELGVEQLAIIPAQHYVIRHIKKKYACACGQCIKRASMPAQALPKSQASAQLIAFLMVSKFIDGLPLYRLEKIAARDGLSVSRQNMARWLIQASHWFDRIVTSCDEQISTYDIASSDETRIQVLKEPGRAATSKSWLWIRRGGPPDKPVVLIDYHPSRASEVPAELLKDYHRGYLVVDACPSYHLVAKENKLTIVGCHDHARRKFTDAYESMTTKQKQTRGGIAKQAIKRYKALYKIESQLKDQSPEQIKAARQQHSLPLLKEFKSWLLTVKQRAVMNEKTQTAVNYFLNQYESLIVYCSDGRLPISNIHTEHIAKTIALARKNFLFTNTQSGASNSAKIYSMILTAMANGLEPRQYLTVLLTELPQIKSNESIEHLLPWNLSSEKLSQMISRLPTP